MAAPGYLITINWTTDSGPQSALIGVDVGMFPSAVGALNSAKTTVQSIQSAKAIIKGGNPTGFTASVKSVVQAAAVAPQ